MNNTVHEWRGDKYTITVDDIRSFWTNFTSSAFDYFTDTVEHIILLSLLYIAICILVYVYTFKLKWCSSNRDLRNFKRVLFVIAHPDDECMFFGPTILNYTRNQKCQVYLMCLTTGRNYGMGKVRKNELYESCKLLGIDQGNIIVHNHTYLPDAMHARWPTELLSNLISHHIDTLNITALITFDRYGVSRHFNHCSIYYAVANLILDNRLPKCCGVYVLETVNKLRKYWLYLDMPVSLVMSRFRYMISFQDRDRYVLNAMKKHKSQLVWFRRLYMVFARYMAINTLQQMNLVDIELDLELDD